MQLFPVKDHSRVGVLAHLGFKADTMKEAFAVIIGNRKCNRVSRPPVFAVRIVNQSENIVLGDNSV